MTEKTNKPQKTTNNKDTNQQNKTNNNKLFCYEIDTTHILIEPEIKMEVLEQSIIYPIPNAPKWYLGVTSLRGDILTVVNMHFLLNSKSNLKEKRLLKLKHPDFPALVIAIDKLPYQSNIERLVTYNKNNNKQYPAWIKSSLKQNEKTFLVADHPVLFKAMQATVGDEQ